MAGGTTAAPTPGGGAGVEGGAKRSSWEWDGIRLAMSYIPAHEAETLRRWALNGLCGKKERQRCDVIGGLHPFALYAQRLLRFAPLPAYS